LGKLRWCEKHQKWNYDESASEETLLNEDPKKERPVMKKLKAGKSVTELLGGVY